MCNKIRNIFLLFSLLSQCFLFAGTALADGVYIPDRAFRKLPGIPTQRAILSYKDGIETLIIESSLNAEGQSFGWILPLPAEPVEIRKTPLELLNVFSNHTEPEIYHEYAGSVLIAFVVLTTFCMIYILMRNSFMTILILVLFGLMILGAIIPRCMPQLGRGHDINEAARSPGVDMTKHVEIGSYEVSVLRASRADELNRWLGNNDFATIPPSGNSIVADYIRQGWVFAVAKLKRQGGGLSTPHPLLVKFPIAKPVYPMRLTALAEGKVFLHLFVVGNGKAKLGGGGDRPTVEFIDKYVFLDQEKEDARYKVFEGKSFHQILSHPYAGQILWPECVVTRYAGSLAPSKIVDDYSVTFSNFTPYRVQYYSKQGAVTKAASYMLLIWGLGLISASLLAKRKGKLYVLLHILLPTLCVCVLGVGLLYVMFPKIEVTTVKAHMASKSRVAQIQIRALSRALDKYASDMHNYPTTAQGLDALISSRMTQWPYGPYYQGSIPKDPWNNPYHYESPGQHSPYDLYTYGEDNEPGGADESEDIFANPL